MPAIYGVVVGGGLNLREQPDTSSARLALIPDGTLLAVNDRHDDWYRTTYGAYGGYVMKRYVTLTDDVSDAVLQGSVTGGRLNLRRAASLSADVLTRIPDGADIDVTDYDAGGTWYRAAYGGYAGYVMKRYVALGARPVGDWAYGRVTSGTLNVRKAPAISAALWNNVWPGNRVALIRPVVAGWYETIYRGEPAYVSADFIEPLDDPVPRSIVARMTTMALPELGRDQSVYYNGYTGDWCHRFADWLAMHAAQPKARVPNTANCGVGIVWFVNDARSGGFFFKSAAHKARMIGAYPAIGRLPAALTDDEIAYAPAPGDYVYFRWSGASPSVNVSHVGIVRAVASDTLTTFEGNAGNRVVSRTYPLSDERIVGYGKPIYEENGGRP